MRNPAHPVIRYEGIYCNSHTILCSVGKVYLYITSPNHVTGNVIGNAITVPARPTDGPANDTPLSGNAAVLRHPCQFTTRLK